MAQNLNPALDDPAIAAALRAALDERNALLRRGDRAIGWKVAITHPPTQSRLGLVGPLVGYLTQNQVFDAEDVRLPAAGVKVVELEVALQIGADLSPAPGVEECRAAISHLAPALEILSITGPLDKLDSLVASNAYHAGVRFGAWVPAAQGLGEPTGQAALWHNGREVGSFDPARVVGTPEAAVGFIARTLAFFGERLVQGDRVICGSLNKPVVVGPGSRISATLAGMGEVSLILQAV